MTDEKTAPAQDINPKLSSYHKKRKYLVNYMKLKIIESDWHAVSDAANDLRVLEAIHYPPSETIPSYLVTD